MLLYEHKFCKGENRNPKGPDEVISLVHPI